jgi:hypothetical protein
LFAHKPPRQRLEHHSLVDIARHAELLRPHGVIERSPDGRLADEQPIGQLGDRERRAAGPRGHEHQIARDRPVAVLVARRRYDRIFGPDQSARRLRDLGLGPELQQPNQPVIAGPA